MSTPAFLANRTNDIFYCDEAAGALFGRASSGQRLEAIVKTLASRPVS